MRKTHIERAKVDLDYDKSRRSEALDLAKQYKIPYLDFW